MEALKRARRTVRREFEIYHKELEALLKEEPLKVDLINVKFKLFVDTCESLQSYDASIMEQLTTDDVPEAEENKQYDEIREFNVRAETIRQLKDKLMPPPPPIQTASTESVAGVSNTGDNYARKFKLPAVKMKKFNGDIKDWLGFWAQFSKIHNDEHLSGSEKYWFLLQSVEPGTDAYEVVTTYPPSNESYDVVIEALKKQYAHEDLQLQVYISEILSLVITNVNAKEKLSVKSLFLKLDSHLRALNTLNLKKADPATWLFPLVESCLPEQLLYHWQQNPLSTHDGSKDDPPRTRLEILMSFIEREVQIRQRMDITKNFANQHGESKQASTERKPQNKDKRMERRAAVPTLSSFHVADKKSCAFCEKINHESADCYRAQKMTIQEKEAVLREKRLCFRCAGRHLISQCNTNVRCDNCQRGGHITVLCRERKVGTEKRWSTGTVTGQRGGFSQKRKPDDRSGGGTEPKVPRGASTSQTVSSSANLECTGEVCLQTLLVKVGDGVNSKVVRAFIDSGSQRSYLLKSTARSLGLNSIGSESAVHSLFGGQQTSTIIHNKYQIQLSSVESDFVRTVEIRDHVKICGNLPKVSIKYPEVMEELKMKNVKLTDVDPFQTQIELLIGADVYPSILTGRIEKLKTGTVAVHTELGWTLLGPVSEKSKDDDIVATYIAMSTPDADVAKLWELEVIGVEDPAQEITEKKRLELETAKFMENISIQEDGRYCVSMPWRNNLSHLPSNRQVAFKRLQSASKKLNEQELFEAYDVIFKDWEKARFIERVNVETTSDVIHYLPHRPIIKNSLTTPVRPVFDASCRQGKAPSLNDCLFTGENYVKAIPDLIQRFREKKIGFVSDIRKAFQMIGVKEEDRDAMRLLWWEDKKMEKLIEFRHARVMFGATCSPFILGAVLFYHLTNLPEEKKELGLKLLSTLYVDNCVSSEDIFELYQEFRREATELLKSAGMDLRMWMSNVDEFDDEATHIISVLGLMWDRKRDELFIQIKDSPPPEKITKRSVLSAVQKIYDPIGFTSPAVLPMKLLLQRVWISKLKWDQLLPETERDLFLKWRNEIADLGKIRLPRISTAGVINRDNWSVHIFTDASKDAYAGTIFLRVETEDSVNVQLLSAKSRVAPIKPMTIPKLELMGCLIGKRLCASVKCALKLEGVKEYYWCDSTTALAWIRRDPDQWGTFVANRAKEIREGASSDKWRHVPGEMNPADLPSRGCLPSKLLSSNWWEGPEWLYEDEESWPKSNEEVDEKEIAAEKRKSNTATLEVNSSSIIENVRKAFSWGKQIRILAWVRRFLFNKLIRKPELRRKGYLKNSELDRAEFILVRQLQHEAFPKDERSKLTGLEIFEDDWGILRVKTRLTYRKDSLNFKYPMLLPKEGDAVAQLIGETHRNYCHAGVGFLQIKLRKRYWILKGRHTIKRIVNKCVQCKRFSAKHVVPKAAPLPLDRIKSAEVFEVVGVDLAGPLTLRNGKKVWLVIFTCAVYRAVHFELVTKISTKAFIIALEKFIQRFRRPSIIYSDNGTNFRGAAKLFKQVKWNEISQDRKWAPIIWKFNPVTSSWWGGWWERLIRTAKDLLRRTVGKGSLTMTELRSVVDMIAEVMNDRPLTYVSENPDDLDPLTPALFLHPLGNVNFPESGATESEQLRLRHKYISTLKQEQKDRFLKEYLAMLVNRNPKKASTGLMTGELVLVGCDNLKRLEWPLGRVTELIPGKDGAVRLAKVKTAKGEITRSVQRLFSLEMDVQAEEEKAIREKGMTTRSGRRVKKPARFQN